MMYRLLLTCLFLLTLVACGSSSDGPPAGTNYLGQLLNCESSATEVLVGCWYSEACVQSNVQTNYYQQGVLNFHNNGKINYGMRFYDNDTCTGTPFVTDATPPDDYTIVDAVTSSGGLMDTIILALTGSGVTLYTAYYITASNRLCFDDGDYQIDGNGGGLIPFNLSAPAAGDIMINTNTDACLTK